MNAGQLWDGRTLSAEAYTDPTVFQREMGVIFGRGWVYVGHDSEVSQPGMFTRRRIGTTPVVLVRGSDHQVRVLVNRCSHRGALVCRSERGAANVLRCAYHGWTYRNDGSLAAIPLPEAYEEGNERFAGLPSLPCEVHQGFVFAALTEPAESLSTHLGAAAGYLTAFATHIPGSSLSVTSTPHRVVGDFNWKLQVENGVDGYHATFTHKSYFDIVKSHVTGPIRRSIKEDGVSTARALGNGHTVLDYADAGRDAVVNRLQTLEGAERLLVEGNLPDDEDVAALLKSVPGPGFNLSVFPNLQVIGIHIRRIHPVQVSRTEVELRPTLGAQSPDDVNALRLRYHEYFYGPAAFGQPDDLEMFQRVAAGVGDGHAARIDLTRGLHRERHDSEGVRIGEMSDEVAQRATYDRWTQLMTAGASAAFPTTDDGAP